VARVVIDPVTRIGGHLRLEAEVQGVVEDAWSSGTMFRGFELILRDRDPRDAYLFAQRICGMCNGTHALGAVRAVEDAFGIQVPPNARLLRNLLAGATFVRDHVLAFYQLQLLDWADFDGALAADPAATSTLATSIGDWSLSSPQHFGAVQARLQAFASSGRLGIFANGYWGHPAYTLSPEADLLLISHYLDALDWQRRFTRLFTMLGGKSPHLQNYCLGGMVTAPPWGGPAASPRGEHPSQVERDTPPALSDAGVADMRTLIVEARTFVEKVLMPDVRLVTGHYRDWATIGRGTGNYLSYGEFPETDTTQPSLLLPRGRLMDGDLANVLTVKPENIGETVVHAYYRYPEDDALYLGPGDGVTDPKYAGPPAPVTTLQGSTKYSWVKAARYAQEPMEVGALARMLVAFATGNVEVQAGVADAIETIGAGEEGIVGTLGRMATRAVEAQVLVNRLEVWLDRLTANMAAGDLALANIAKWDPKSWPADAEGLALGEGPRGSVGHWVSTDGRRISAYQIVDATTWNASPRDALDRRGPLEQALVRVPVLDPRRPLEILRVAHSFDPCTACAAHAYRPVRPARAGRTGEAR
jgi:Ni,Fe-hydrogenase I large subunit